VDHRLGIAVAEGLCLAGIALGLEAVAAAQEQGAVEADAIGTEEDYQRIAALGACGVAHEVGGAVGQVAGALLDAGIGDIGDDGLRPGSAPVAAQRGHLAVAAALIAEDHHQRAVRLAVDARLELARLVAPVVIVETAPLPAAGARRMVGIDRTDV